MSMFILSFGNSIYWKSSNLLAFIWQANFTMVFMCLIVALDYYRYFPTNLVHEIDFIEWIHVGSLNVNISGFFDTLTIVMLFVITTVSSLVQHYSQTYMKYDPHILRFMSYLSLFTFFMLILVTSGNFLQLFMGWEGVGICSYLLINFWHTRIQANKAAIKALLVNRIGDTAFAIGIFIIFTNFNTLDFPLLSTLIFDVKGSQLIDINTIAFFLFIGCMGKSAQIGLHTWLPDAMEGPTPVSALLHAATMVTAGVFLLVRCSFIFQEAHYILPFITLIGALTTFLAASTAIVQNDIKKVIAYSTCSQLGYMVMACGLSNFNGAMFHLYNHAFFKALLFLTAGSIIHALDNEQDLRKMGGLINILPFSYTMMLIGSLALMGFPFLSGYYSKEFILEVALSKSTVTGDFAFWLGSLSSGCTAFYSIRSLIFIFFGKTNSHKKIIEQAHDTPVGMKEPLFILATLSIFTGYISKDFFIGLGTPFWGNSIIYYSCNYYSNVYAEFLPFNFKVIPLIFSFVGSFLAFFLYTYVFKNSKTFMYNSYYNFFNKKWYFDLIYNDVLIQKSLDIGYNISYKVLDRGFLEIVGIKGFTKNYSDLSHSLIRTQSGHPYHYFLFFVLGSMLLMIFTSMIVLQLPLLLIFLILFSVSV